MTEPVKDAQQEITRCVGCGATIYLIGAYRLGHDDPGARCKVCYERSVREQQVHRGQAWEATFAAKIKDEWTIAQEAICSLCGKTVLPPLTESLFFTTTGKPVCLPCLYEAHDQGPKDAPAEQHCLHCNRRVRYLDPVFAIQGFAPYCQTCHGGWVAGVLRQRADGRLELPLDIAARNAPATTQDGVCTLCGQPDITLPYEPERPLSVLAEAAQLVDKDRKHDYGQAAESFWRIAALWGEVLDIPVTADQVALCLIQLKVARAINDTSHERPIKRDTIVDIAGYACCLGQLLESSLFDDQEDDDDG